MNQYRSGVEKYGCSCFLASLSFLKDLQQLPWTIPEPPPKKTSKQGKGEKTSEKRPPGNPSKHIIAPHNPIQNPRSSKSSRTNFSESPRYLLACKNTPTTIRMETLVGKDGNIRMETNATLVGKDMGTWFNDFKMSRTKTSWQWYFEGEQGGVYILVAGTTLGLQIFRCVIDLFQFSKSNL